MPRFEASIASTFFALKSQAFWAFFAHIPFMHILDFCIFVASLRILSREPSFHSFSSSSKRKKASINKSKTQATWKIPFLWDFCHNGFLEAKTKLPSWFCTQYKLRASPSAFGLSLSFPDPNITLHFSIFTNFEVATNCIWSWFSWSLSLHWRSESKIQVFPLQIQRYIWIYFPNQEVCFKSQIWNSSLYLMK